MPEPRRSHVDASLVLIDDLEARITQIAKELRRSGADHRYIPILMSAPGFGRITSFTVACEIGDISRFSSPVKLTGYTGLCPRVKQSGQMDQRGPLQERAPISALGADGGRDRRLLAPALPRALPAHQAPPWSPARTQGRPDRPGSSAHRGDLVHAYS